MRKYFAITTLILMLGLAAAACDRSDVTRDTSASPTPGAMTNSDLEKKIDAQLDQDARLKAADLNVDADVAKNQVTLTGTVESQALKAKAIEIAKTAHAGVIVNDKITVKPRDVARADYTEEMGREAREKAKRSGETIGSTLDDAWIHTKIVAQLIGDADTPQRKINVDVNNNVVTLRGTVETAVQKTEAERIAKSTEGVKRVSNQLKVEAKKG
jgi:osmotically-inducible protein OsmY